MKSPPRAWCLGIRAADRRIGTHNALFDFPSWYDLPEDDPTPEEDFIRDGEAWNSALARGIAHTITITGSLVRDLTKPVVIPWPGKPQSEVARLLGRAVETIHYWIDRESGYPYGLPAKAGSLASGRAPRRFGKTWKPGMNGCVLKLWGYDYCMNHSRNGPAVPIVYTPSPIDPNHAQGRSPDPVWGSLWQGLWEKMPEEFEQEITRVPRWRTVRGRRMRCGWRWVCPGLRNANGKRQSCGRTCLVLYAPMPIWTLGKSGDLSLALDMPADSGLAGQWHPGEHEPPMGMDSRAFACHKCWKVSQLQLSDQHGWNRFVTYITGGLLYGHEVKRPMGEVPKKRKRRFAERPGRAAPRREQVVELLVRGLTYVEIGRRLGITRSVVSKHVVKIYCMHNVHSRAELIAKLCSDATMKESHPHSAHA